MSIIYWVNFKFGYKKLPRCDFYSVIFTKTKLVELCNIIKVGGKRKHGLVLVS